ncbi:MAG: Holliday junction branch migration protein RuvA [bacterium]|nr:Holliday junction branch migration protein RuvA [bacterium]
MYEYIKGVITEIYPSYVVLEANNVGYLIYMPNPYSVQINGTYTLYVYQKVSDDSIALYGFKTFQEKELFLKLISVSGIGPKSALSILATGDVNGIISAIDLGNAKYLTKFPGIGTKASQQIILDLQGKINFNQSSSNSTTELEEALISLGYKKKDIDKVCSKLDMSLKIEDLIKEALKLLTRM